MIYFIFRVPFPPHQDQCPIKLARIGAGRDSIPGCGKNVTQEGFTTSKKFLGTITALYILALESDHAFVPSLIRRDYEFSVFDVLSILNDFLILIHVFNTGIEQVHSMHVVPKGRLIHPQIYRCIKVLIGFEAMQFGIFVIYLPFS